MAKKPSRRILFELHRTAFWPSNAPHSAIENLVEYILTGQASDGADPEVAALAEQALRFDLGRHRMVVIGGGTGHSTVVGGNSYLENWPDRPDVGLKREFPHLTSIVCTTDDGGSSGALLQLLPMIAVGDLRKLLLSSILPQNLQKAYGLNAKKAAALLRAIHSVLTHRITPGAAGLKELCDPLVAIPGGLRGACPERLAEAFRELGGYLAPGGKGPTIPPARHSVGNLLLTAAIFQEAHGDTSRPPRLRDVQNGIDRIAHLIGAPAGTIHAATAVPGQLQFRYANGVEVMGQGKSARYRRTSPVERVTAVYTLPPTISPAVRKALREADVIVYAPGSLYTSILPVLQIEPIVAAIRSNRRALKVLGANAWIQEGETDISLKNEGRGFLASELVEAYARNIRGGIEGLFDVVLCANLEHVPGSILRNYALEGKHPIYLDKARVEAMGVHPVEATLFSQTQPGQSRVIQHDPQRFALAVKTLLYADRNLQDEPGYLLRAKGVAPSIPHAPASTKSERTPPPLAKRRSRRLFLCEHMQAVRQALRGKKFQQEALRDFFYRVAWEHRDIRPEHLDYFKGVSVLAAKQWERNTEWDNVLGYFDPEDRRIKLHQSLLENPESLQENLLIALGESLLGRYIEKRRWIQLAGGRCYEITLRPEGERACYLSNGQLRTYLRLVRMVPDPGDDRVYRITLNQDGGFFPSGLTFGLQYSWYLTGRGLAAEYEMTLLRWPEKALTPLHAKARARKEALVRFFRTEVFGHGD
ncbi:MAG: YvcK family protein [Acidobacteriota bacterium]|jgi:uncharacterized cofD-like protein|nr:YvcK family protein [Acidobacteriota bacterium]